MNAQAELFDLKVERRKRDAVLDLLDKRRAELSPRLFESGYELLAVWFFFSGVGLLYFSEGE